MSAIWTSIITGIIVFFITWPINNYLTKKTSKSDYYKRVKKAKYETIQILIDYIISFKDINEQLINEIKLSQSVEFGIDIKDIYTLKEIKSILLKEFIIMKLMPEEQRKEIINLISEKILDKGIESTELSEQQIDIYKKVNIYSNEKQLIKRTTALMSLICALITPLINITQILENSSSDIQQINLNSINEKMIVLVMIILLVGTLVISIIKISKRRNNKMIKNLKDII